MIVDGSSFLLTSKRRKLADIDSMETEAAKVSFFRILVMFFLFIVLFGRFLCVFLSVLI